jgi:GT2 family glycosyltransferase
MATTASGEREDRSVWVVVPHYGDAGTTRGAVAAILSGAVRPGTVLVVDNQGDLPAFDETDVEVVRPGRNLGFGGACVLGIRRALAGGAAWVWVFNNDAEPARDCLAELLAVGTAEPRAGLLSPVILHRDRPTFWYAGGDLARRTLQVTHRGRPAQETPHDVDFITGCAWLARRGFIDECGPPDDGLFMYFEDVDWSLRAQAAGWRTILVPAAHAVHDARYEHGRRIFSPPAIYYMTRNRLLLGRRWGTPVATCAAAVTWGGRQLVKCRSAADAARVTLAVTAGLVHGLAGRRGPAPAGLLRRLR